MIFASPSSCRPRIDRVTAQISVARTLALNGSAGLARTVCGSIFLDHLPLLERDPEALDAYVECLLLLEMSALLPRVVQAIHGVSLDVVPMSGRAEGRRWLLKFGTGVTLAMPVPARAERTQSAARWSKMILQEAAREFAGEPAPAAAALESVA